MAFARIGILSIGEMGYHWAKILTGRGRGFDLRQRPRARPPANGRRTLV